MNITDGFSVGNVNSRRMLVVRDYIPDGKSVGHEYTRRIIRREYALPTDFPSGMVKNNLNFFTSLTEIPSAKKHRRRILSLTENFRQRCFIPDGFFAHGSLPVRDAHP